MESALPNRIAVRLEQFLSHGSASVGRERALVIRRARGFALIGFAVVFFGGFITALATGQQQLAIGSLSLILFMGGSLAIGFVQESRWLIPVTHLGMGIMLYGIISSAIHIGYANDISANFPIVLILVSVYVLGVRAGLFWTLASIGGMSIAVYTSEIPSGINGESLVSVPGMTATRGIVHFAVFALAAVERRFGDRQSRELEYLARHDSLTNLYNRRAFEERFSEAVSRCLRYERRIALLVIDLDGFKAINDHHGHAAGDELLRAIGRRIMARIRKTDVAGRVGGDEYLILLEDISDDKDVQLFAERLRAELAEPVWFNDAELQVGTSIGIATLPEAANDVDGLARAADLAMYVGKSRGGNIVHFHDPEGPSQV